MKMRILPAVVAATLLAGCQTQQVEEMTYTQQKEFVNQMAMRCVKQGYGPQSGEFRQCYEAEYKREVALRVRAKQREDIQLANPAPVSPQVTCRTTSYEFGNPVMRCS